MDALEREKGGCSLVAEALREWGTVKVRATGMSMLPALWPGDLLTIHSLPPERAEPGEILLYMRQGRFFIHRMVGKNLAVSEAEPFLITRGDCTPGNDPPVSGSELLGKVTEVRRAGAVFVPATKLSPLHRIAAYAFCHCGLFRRAWLRIWERYHSGNGRSEPARVKAAS